jgi:hypothetical protein
VNSVHRPNLAVVALMLALAIGAPSARAGGEEPDRPALPASLKGRPVPPADLVPNREFPTIQAAIDAAEDGATIGVRPGVFREVLTIAGKRLRITGAGTHGRRTEIQGPRLTAVDEATRATGLVNYVEGGGGVLEGLVLRGGLNGVVGQPPPERGAGDLFGDGDVPPAVAGSLHVSDLVIEDTGRGILWRTGTDLAVRDTHIARMRKNGIVFRPLRRPEATAKLVDVVVDGAATYGVLVMNTASIGCANQLTNVHVTLGVLGGIGVFHSGVCISGGVLTLNGNAGIYMEKSAAIVDGTVIQSTLYTTIDEFHKVGGNGILAVASDLQLVTNAVLQLQLAGVFAYGTPFTLGWNKFNCHSAYDIAMLPMPADALGPGDPPAPIDSTPHDAGGNWCGCGAVEKTCSAAGPLTPPSPVDADSLE